MSADRVTWSEPRYTIHDERFRRMILGNARLTVLAEGLDWAEGPVWYADHAMLVFSDVPANRELCWREHSGVSVYRAPSDYANGHARDRAGRLLIASHGRRAVLRVGPDGRETVLADRFGGRRLNAPNDLVCHSDGSVWFSDPVYGIETDFEGHRAQSENRPAIYRIDPAGGEPAAMITDCSGPNGLAFSPDESVLYVSDTGEQFAVQPLRRVRRYAIGHGGAVGHGAVGDGGVGRGVVGPGEDFASVSPGYTDGMAVDEAGNLWLSAGDGVHCLASDGTLLGQIHTDAPVGNLCFGGRALTWLFLCASHSLLTIPVNMRGLALV